MEGVKI